MSLLARKDGKKILINIVLRKTRLIILLFLFRGIFLNSWSFKNKIFHFLWNKNMFEKNSLRKYQNNYKSLKIQIVFQAFRTKQIILKWIHQIKVNSIINKWKNKRTIDEIKAILEQNENRFVVEDLLVGNFVALLASKISQPTENFYLIHAYVDTFKWSWNALNQTMIMHWNWVIRDK